MLAAMAILCQGYLAVVAAETQPQEGSSVAQALSVMGWDCSKHSNLVRSKLSEVQNPNWWLEVLTLHHKEKQRKLTADEQWRGIADALAPEWGKGSELFLALDLMECLRCSRPVVEPQFVAEVYLRIAEHLRAH
jgi:hypothetical protein